MLPERVPEPDRLARRRPQPTSEQHIHRLERLILNRRDKLGPMIRSSTGRIGGRDRPDRRDRYYTDADAETLYMAGLRAWRGVRGLTRLPQGEFAFRWAQAQVDNVFRGIYEPMDWQKPVLLFADLGVADPDGEVPVDGGVTSIIETMGPDEWINWREAAAATGDAVRAETARRFERFEAELRQRLSPAAWRTWRGYRDVPAVELSRLAGVSMKTLYNRERRVVLGPVTDLWLEMFDTDLPQDLARRRRHDLPRVTDISEVLPYR
jgi:hypothetical protein